MVRGRLHSPKRYEYTKYSCHAEFLHCHSELVSESRFYGDPEMDSASLDITSAVTLSSWIKPNTVQSDQYLGLVFKEKGTGVSDAYGMELYG